MEAVPTKRLIAQAIRSARDGNVREYLAKSAASASPVNERTLRNGFKMMTTRAPGPGSPLEADRLCRELNGYYRTRYSISKLTSLVPIICDAIHSRDWWQNPPPGICDASTPALEEIASIVPLVLSSASATGLDRPYSLVTKFLHFSFPNSFGIYDAQAAASIQTWSYFSFPLGDPDGLRFSMAHMSNPTGNGYHAIMGFYRLCWEHATAAQLLDLQSAAQALTLEIGAPVSPLYIIDNLIWNANGDPRLLGLLPT